MVVWIIGLSGSGKTTLAEKIIKDANEIGLKPVLIDGDSVRDIFNNDLGYSMEDRLKNAYRICNLGKFLSDQGFCVVCSILSIFPDTRDWNRKNIKNYYEVFIDTPIEILIERDPKKLYKKYKSGEIKNVVGMDIDFPAPINADLKIINDGSREKLLDNSKKIIEFLKPKSS